MQVDLLRFSQKHRWVRAEVDGHTVEFTGVPCHDQQSALTDAYAELIYRASYDFKPGDELIVGTNSPRIKEILTVPKVWGDGPVGAAARNLINVVRKLRPRKVTVKEVN